MQCWTLARQLAKKKKKQVLRKKVAQKVLLLFLLQKKPDQKRKQVLVWPSHEEKGWMAKFGSDLGMRIRMLQRL